MCHFHRVGPPHPGFHAAAQHFASYRGDGGTKLFHFFFCLILFFLFSFLFLPFSVALFYIKHSRKVLSLCNIWTALKLRSALPYATLRCVAAERIPTRWMGGGVILDGACLMESNFLCKLCFSLSLFSYSAHICLYSVPKSWLINFAPLSVCSFPSIYAGPPYGIHSFRSFPDPAISLLLLHIYAWYHLTINSLLLSFRIDVTLYHLHQAFGLLTNGNHPTED